MRIEWVCGNRIKIQDKADCFSFHVNALGKYMNLSFLSTSIRQ